MSRQQHGAWLPQEAVRANRQDVLVGPAADNTWGATALT